MARIGLAGKPQPLHSPFLNRFLTHTSDNYGNSQGMIEESHGW